MNDCKCCWCSKYECDNRCPNEHPDVCRECFLEYKDRKQYIECKDYDELGG